MRIRLLRNLGHGWPPYKVDEIVDAEDALAAKLVDRGLAEVLPPIIQAVPPKPAQLGVPKIETVKQKTKPQADVAGTKEK